MSAAAYRRTTIIVWRYRMLLECAASNISLYLSLYLSSPGKTSYESHIIWSFNLPLMDLFNHLLQFAKRLTACFQLTLYVKTQFNSTKAAATCLISGQIINCVYYTEQDCGEVRDVVEVNILKCTTVVCLMISDYAHVVFLQETPSGITVDRSSPPSTKTRTPGGMVTVPDYTWQRSGMDIVSTQIQTGFIVGGLTVLSLLLEWSGTTGRAATTP